MKHLVYLSIFLLITLAVHGQGTGMDPDEAFSRARQLAFDSKRTEAKALLTEITRNYPNYGDVRLFLAVLYGWEEEYKLARREFQVLLAQEKTNKNYWIAYIKNELWAGQSAAAKELSKKALELFPEEGELVILRAKAERDNGELGQATQTLKDFLRKHPQNQEVNTFFISLKEDLATNNLSVSYALDHFSEIYDPMHYYTLQYSKETARGSIVGRLNVNEKFRIYGTQFELDAYPSITDGLYAYLNAGYSGSSIFPGWRYGAQLYKSLPLSFEVSAGIRSLKFGEQFTHIYTGSVGKYFGNSFLFFVPYLIPADEGLSKSGNLTYRYYGSTEDLFFAVTAGMGFSPEINRFGNEETLPIISLKSQKVGISNTFKLGSANSILGFNVSLNRQESIFDPGQFFFITSAGVQYLVRF